MLCSHLLIHEGATIKPSIKLTDVTNDNRC